MRNDPNATLPQKFLLGEKSMYLRGFLYIFKR